MRNFHFPGRSPVLASNGMVATSQPLASSAAIDVLRNGGNAIDAAVTAAAVLAVVEPHMTGIGGDCFAIVGQPDGTLEGLNGSGRSSSDTSLDWFLERDYQEMPAESALAVTVPGAVRSWDALLKRHGTIGFDQALQPAIGYAAHGFHVSPRVAYDFSRFETKIRNSEMASSVYLDGGELVGIGDRVQNAALSETLRELAKGGADSFYRGPIAEDIVTTVTSCGGFMNLDDLESFSPEFVTPVSTSFCDHDVFELPPNGQGIIAILLLNLLNELPVAESHTSALRYHFELEAAKLAYSVRDTFLGDPVEMGSLVGGIIDPSYARSLLKTVDLTRSNARKLPPMPNADTVYLTVVDRDGRACSLINSLYDDFGSGVMTSTGIMLQNRGSCFCLEPGHINAIGPSKLPLHTIIPAMVKKQGRITHSFGVMGGSYQACGHAHVLQNMLRYGLDPQAALDTPRVFWDDLGRETAEQSISESVLTGLRGKGHDIVQLQHPDTKPIGGGQIIQLDHDRGVLIGGTDPRKDGTVIGI